MFFYNLNMCRSSGALYYKHLFFAINVLPLRNLKKLRDKNFTECHKQTKNASVVTEAFFKYTKLYVLSFQACC